LLSFDIETERRLRVFTLLPSGRGCGRGRVRSKRSVAAIDLRVRVLIVDKRSVHHERISRVRRDGRREGMELSGAAVVLGGVVDVGIDGDAFLYRDA
jgi:hypothetical protein